MVMSAKARQVLEMFRDEYVRRGFPNRRALTYKPPFREEDHAPFRELQTLGLVQGLAAHTWCLSEAGVDWVRANRTDI